jgi:signal transduction histidine kinase
MSSPLGEPTVIVTAGAAFFGLASLVWALRVSDGARGAARRYRLKAQELEERLARSDSVFSAHPGVILVWDKLDRVRTDDAAHDWGEPKIYGSQVALAGLLRYTDDSTALSPAARLLDGLADLEARDVSGLDTTLRRRLKDLRESGLPFSLTLLGPSGSFMEADGRTAGARAVVWISDATLKGIEESSARGRIEEARRLVSRDPVAFLDMLARAPIPAWRMSGGGKLQWANAAYLEAVECRSLEQAVERQAMLDAGVAGQNQRTLEAGAETVEERTLTIRGQRRSMRVHVFPVSGGTGAMALDVTEQVSAREALSRHKRAHDETLNHVADGVAVFGHDRRLSYYNTAFATLLGLDFSFLEERPGHGEVLDRLRQDRKLPERLDYAKWRAEELAVHHDQTAQSEDTWMLGNGRLLQLKRQRHPLGGIMLLFRDITSEADTAARYKTMLHVHEATLDNLHEGVAVFGPDARLKLWNRAFQRLWDLPDAVLRHNADYDEVIAACQALYAKARTWGDLKARITNPSAEMRESWQGEMSRSNASVLSFVTQPLPDESTLIAFLDRTADRNIERALLEKGQAYEVADRMKTDFITNVSRQLRDPLQAVGFSSELLLSGRVGTLTDHQGRLVEAISTAQNRLGHLVEQILEIAMIDAGHVELELAPVDIADVVARARESVISRASETQVELRVDIPADLGPLNADPRRIQQMLMNVLSNALRFSLANGIIEVKARRVGEMLELSVADNGKGIDYDRQAAVFDAFHTGDRQGAGLGLALVRKYTDLHHGSVMMKSDPGVGTTVTFYLPFDLTPAFDPVIPDAVPTALAA